MNAPSGINFPDEPKSELDLALTSLISSAERVAQTQGRLRGLLRANTLVFEQLDLPTVLRSVVEATVELLGARYVALGVLSPEGGLEDFLQTGMTDEEVARIGHLPQGHGLLAAVMQDPDPIRLDTLQGDPRSSGWPADHPPMESFLGVPIRVRSELFGSLYAAEKAGGTFTEEDEELLVSLASTAGIAIEHARLFEETRLRQRWAAVSAENAAALSSANTRNPLRFLADSVVELAQADLVCIVMPLARDSLIVEVARGSLPDRLEGLVISAAGTLTARVLADGRPLLVESLRTSPSPTEISVDLGPSMLIPLLSGGQAIGVITISRALGQQRFTQGDLEMADDFARQATLAIDIARVGHDRERLALLEDRNRIARDLHDHVVQRLFAAGLDLQASVRESTDPIASARFERHIDTLDQAISEIRTAIFALAPLPHVLESSLRNRIIELLSEIGGMFPTTPRLAFVGPLDLEVDRALGDDVIAVIREGLSNVARHAQASTVSVRVFVDDGSVGIEISDDGVGVPETGRRSGLANLRARANRWGGSLQLDHNSEGGTLLTWMARLPRDENGTNT